jgi:hypothetical protein
MTDITWQAHYTDGSTLPQGNGATYTDIERDKLQAFDLWRGEQLLVRVDLRPDSNGEVGQRRLIWRMRRRLDTGGGQMTIHMVGWQRTVNGRNVQAICYVFEDGVVLLGGQFTGKDFMDEITVREWEKDLL